MRSHPAATLFAFALFAPLGCAGSAASRDAAMMTSDRPPDRFAISLTVLGPESHSVTDSPPPPDVRPARYLLETDWVLRSTTLPWLISPHLTPPRTRQLDHREAAAVWAAFRDSGLMDEESPDRVGRAPDVEDPFDPTGPLGGGIVYVLEFRAGERRGILVTRESDADSDPVKSLAGRLAALAWVE